MLTFMAIQYFLIKKKYSYKGAFAIIISDLNKVPVCKLTYTEGN